MPDQQVRQRAFERGGSMKLRHLILLFPVATLVMGAAVPGTASAQGAVADGATVYERSGCVPYGEGTLCYENRGVESTVETPSGVLIRNFAGQSTSTYTGPDGCSWTRTFDKNEHWTIRSGQHQESHVLQRSIFTDPCSGEPVECVWRLHFHHANGGAQIFKNETTCTPL